MCQSSDLAIIAIPCTSRHNKSKWNDYSYFLPRIVPWYLSVFSILFLNVTKHLEGRAMCKRSAALSLTSGPETEGWCDRSISLAIATTTVMATIFGEYAYVPDFAPGVSYTRLDLTLRTLWGCNYILILEMRDLVTREMNYFVKVATEIQNQSFLTLLSQ